MIKKRFSVSRYQQSFYFDWCKNPNSLRYNLPYQYDISGDLDVTALREVLETYINDVHHSARSYFVERNGVLYQQSLSLSDFTCIDVDVSNADSPIEKLEQIYERIAYQPFSLATGPLYRFAIVRYSQEKYRLIACFHHIIFDGMAYQNFVKIITKLYREVIENNTKGKVASKELLGAYLQAEEKYSDEDIEKDKVFWQQSLSGCDPVIAFAHKSQAGFDKKTNGRSITFSVDKKSTSQLKKIADKNSTSLFRIISSVYGALLCRLFDRENILLSCPVQMRRLEHMELIGCYINNLPVLVDVKSNDSFIDVILRVEKWVQSSKSHKRLPTGEISKILRELGQLKPGCEINAAIAHSPGLLRKMAPIFMSCETDVVPVKYFEPVFDIALNFDETNEVLYFQLDYNMQLIPAEWARNFVVYFKRYIKFLLKAPVSKPALIELMSLQEFNSVVNSKEILQKDVAPWLGIHEQLQSCALLYPKEIAIVAQGDQITYGELNSKANQLGALLKTKIEGVNKKEPSIAIVLDKSIELVIAMIAILKIGAHYVPINRDYPAQMIHYIVDDSEAAVLITKKRIYKNKAEPGKAYILYLDDSKVASDLSQADVVNINHPVQQDTLAYMVYTSGSTGKPKGVMVSHSAVMRLVTTDSCFNILPSDRIISLANISFDAFVFEVWASLCRGAELVLTNPEVVYDVDKLERHFKQYPQATAFMTTALFNHIIDAKPEVVNHLKHVLFGGEKVNVKKVNKLLPSLAAKLTHVYGPTETCVFSMYFHLNPGKELLSEAPIGKAFDGERVYVLDQYKQLCPVGCQGELYISGAGVAKGYKNLSTLTNEHFVNNPYGKGKLYKTGDHVVCLPNGDIVYLDRKDDQIKVNGFRVEIGAVETVLNRHPDVMASAVVFEKGESTQLVGFYVADNSLTVEELYTYLQNNLPAFSIPSQLKQVKEFVLTANGKINRRVLPQLPTIENAHCKNKISSTPMEKKIAYIWRRVLKCHEIKPANNFFHLGGHSLLVGRVIAGIQKDLRCDVAIIDLFKHPVLKDFANLVERRLADRALVKSFNAIPKVDRANKKYFPLSYAQERLWFLDAYSKGSSFHYNIPFCFRIFGKVNIDALERSINRLIERHEALRTFFVCQQGQPKQIVSDFLSIKVSCTTVNKKYLNDNLIEEIHTPFTLSELPLIRVKLMKTGDLEYVLTVVMHHIISDGWSMGIFVRELSAYYNSFAKGEKFDCDELPIQYPDFSLWERNNLTEQALKAKLNYWKDSLANFQLLNFPLDKARKKQQSFNGDHHRIVIDKELTAAIRSFCKKSSVTLSIPLLSIYQVLLSIYSQQDDILIGMGVANRSHADCESIFGFFVNTVPIRTYIDAKKTLMQLVADVNDSVLNALQHQEVPFEAVVDAVSVKRDNSKMPLIQHSFILQNANNKDKLNFFQCEIEFIESPFRTSKVDMSLSCTEVDDVIEFDLEYNTDLFTKETVTNLLKLYKNLLGLLIKCPQREIQSLPLLSQQEIANSLANKTARKNQYHAVINSFEDIVNKFPNATALVYEHERLTYKQVNSRANCLARYLISHYKNFYFETSEKNCIAAILMERSIDMVVAMLAILKSGMGYLPLDPSYPAERLKYMISDSQPFLVLTNINYQKLGGLADLSFFIDIDDIDFADNCDDSNLDLLIRKEDVFSVIYTSGSTGSPKGVVVTQKNISVFVESYIDYFEFRPGTSFLQFCNISFDPSLSEIFVSLLSGSALYIASEMMRKDPIKLADYIAAMSLEVITLPAAVLSVMPEIKNDALHTVITGGELCPKAVLDRWAEKCYVYNAYGPTECTVTSTINHYRSVCNANNIGYPMRHVNFYVLDRFQRLCPPGVPGELYIGGDAVSQGYINNTDLTRAAFINDPLNPDGSDIFYKTGDKVRLAKGGCIEFLGRLDNQIKLRGFRIEVAEIESCINSLPEVNRTIVRDDPNVPGVLQAYCEIDYTLATSAINSENKWVGYWKDLNEAHYSNYVQEVGGAGNKNPAWLDFTGWVSSFSQKQIPTAEMNDWVEKTVKRIAKLAPQNILEIGCGSGLLLYPLMQYCQRFYGIELSENAIERLKNDLSVSKVKNVELYVGDAQSVKQLFSMNDDKIVDTIVINSVCQYFPSERYLDKVIEDAVELVQDGAIFIGDVRDLRLLESFHLAVEMSKGKTVDLKDAYVKAVNQASSEKELLISPIYFIKKARALKKITSIEMLPKEGRYDNELNRFRYDVVLHIGKKDSETPKLEWISWHERMALATHLESSANDFIAIKGYPNKRVWREFQTAQACKNNQSSPEQYKKINISQVLSIFQLQMLAKQYGYFVNIHLNLDLANAPACFNLIFSKHEDVHYCLDDFQMNDYVGFPYTACPAVRHSINDNLEIKIKSHVAARLPDYMSPSKYMLLDSFPMTINGKLDVIALQKLNAVSDDKTLPRNAQEEQIALIWKSLLGVASIGVFENFFDLGGNSLMIVRLLHDIKSVFGVSLAVADVFENQTIDKLLRQIIYKKQNSYTPLIPLNSVANGKKIFFVHCGVDLLFGGVECYSALAKAIGEFELIGIDSSYLYGNYIPASLEDLASFYVSHILKVQGQGPFYLGGWCLGGVIAYEIAAQLVRLGHSVDNIIMLDSFNLKQSALLKKIFGDDYTQGASGDKFDLDNRYEYLPLEYINRSKQAALIERRITEHYDPCSIDVPVTLLKAAMVEKDLSRFSQAERFIREKISKYVVNDILDNGWGRLTKQLKVINIESHHNNILTDQGPFAQVVSVIKAVLGSHTHAFATEVN